MDDHFDRVLGAGADESVGSKRSHDAPRESESRSKRRRDAAASESRQRIEELVATADRQALDELDPRALKTMALALDKTIRKNALQRSKYSDDPSKFMESEIQLDEELTKWKAVAAQPTLYPHLIELNVVTLLLGLFSHENLDVRLDVINLVADLTDLDEDPAAVAPTTALVQHLVDHDFLPLLVRTLDDLDRDSQDSKPQTSGTGEEETEEDPSASGAYHALQTVENIVDAVPEAAVKLGESTQIFAVLLRLLSPKREFSTNKLYASEVLSILVQADPSNRSQFLTSGKESNLDRVLQALAPYRKRNPDSDEEEELVENLFNTLCTVLFDAAGQDQFRRLEGLELMLRFLKDRKQYVFTGALRVLDHALLQHARNCERFIEVGGLKAVFPVFMGKKSAKKKELRAKEIESVTSVIASLCLLVPRDAKHEAHARFHAKFVENDMEKMDRVVDLFATYHERVQNAARGDDEDEEDEEDEEQDERFLRRLDAGLFVLQRVALVAAHLSAYSRKLRAYVLVKFHERRLDVDQAVAVLKEQLELLAAEDAESQSKHAGQMERLAALLHAFDEEEVENE